MLLRLNCAPGSVVDKRITAWIHMLDKHGMHSVGYIVSASSHTPDMYDVRDNIGSQCFLFCCLCCVIGSSTLFTHTRLHVNMIIPRKFIRTKDKKYDAAYQWPKETKYKIQRFFSRLFFSWILFFAFLSSSSFSAFVRCTNSFFVPQLLTRAITTKCHVITFLCNFECQVLLFCCTSRIASSK